LYAGQLSQPGLFLAQLQARSKQLTALSTPRLGDSLLRPTGEPWLNALIAKAPKLDINNPDQIAALPLGSNLKIDAWDDKVIRLSAGKSPTMSARDKMPFEVTPVFFRLAGFGSATSDPSAPKFEKKIVRIFFATDRAPGEDMQNVQQFTGERAANDDLLFGSADVSIPPGHTMGLVESPSWIRLRVKFDTNKDVVLIEAKRLPASDFMTSLDGQVRDDPKHEALVFVHGYNVSFEDAARRLGQITYDLGFSGAPILYSWPSEGSLIGYSADEANVEWSSPHFLKFLQMLRQDHGIDTVYVLAHSMGNRLVTSAFRSLAQDGTQANAKFRDVIMAAPDVDAGVFKQLAEQIRQAVPHITIYESSNDLALSFSHRFHRYPRLGDTDPNVHVFENYECIVATSVDTSLLGHSYIGDSPSILADIFDLLMTQTPASRRFRLQQYSLGGLPYWAFRK
jgi:esterase/lipase superfamily enzyme